MRRMATKTRWSIASLLNRGKRICWVDLVMWANRAAEALS